MASITIDVVSDVVCPWCYIGQKRLDAAVAAVGDVEVDIRWRPYQLDPTIPRGGKERSAYMLAKFGDAGKIAAIHRRITEAGVGDGIAFDFDAISVAPNTLDAHRLIRWAGATGGDQQAKLVRHLFSLYFERGEDIGDPSVLIDAAREAGMDAAVVEALLQTDNDREAVENEVATASRMGVTGVPCFLIEGKYAVMGAQEPAVLADAIREIAAAKRDGTLLQTA